MIFNSEVDKACIKSDKEKIVALKKIKDENETEGVSEMFFLEYYISY